MPKANPQAHHRYTFSSGARPLEGYTIKRAVGRGGFGEVYYATSDSGKEVALKLIVHNLDVERRGVVQCMNLKCPNLLTIYDLKGNDAGEMFVVMEYVAGPSLANVLAKHPNGLPPAEIRAWMKGLVDGVAYLHDHGIVHRDLKPANLFMEEGIVKIGDYGLAKLINTSHESGHSESIGTCHYMAPEIASGKYNKPIDVYAIGVILYEMLTGRVPFEGESVGEILMKHLTARPDLSKLAEPYRSIVAKALAKDPNHRPARLYDLLPPEDAPQAPSVRFIGDGKVAPPIPPEREVRAQEEEVFRIGPEEPVFYIGPDTRPPRRGPAVTRRIRENLAAIRRPAAPRNAPPPRTRPPAPTVPVAPPVLPDSRIRVAELATAMLWAAVLSVVLALVWGALLGVDISARPQELVYLMGLTLLGSWSVLISNKVTEGRALEPNSRRVVNLTIGLILGGVGVGLAHWILLEPSPGWVSPAWERELSGHLVNLGYNHEPIRLLSYFGLLAVISGGWQSVVARDRKARFRLLPIFGTAFVATILSPVWPAVQPFGVATAVSIAIVTQLVSPWSEGAAAFARAQRYRRIV